jgi:hypothetical protein
LKRKKTKASLSRGFVLSALREGAELAFGSAESGKIARFSEFD